MTLVDTIRRHADVMPHKTALHVAGQDISYRQFWQRIETVTESLKAQGIRPGQRVAWLGLNDPAMLVLLFALMRMGGILLPLNHRLANAELQAILAHAQVSLLLSDETHGATGQALAARLGVAAGNHRLAPGAQTGTEAPSESGAGTLDAALLVYTSGTTGEPKGALHTQAGLLANCVASQHAHAFTPDDHVLTVLPLFHVGGLCIQTLPALHAGAQVTLHARFEPGNWLADVAARRPSMSLLVPATLRAVMSHPEFAQTDLSSLQLLNAGSSTIPLSMIEAFHARGIPVCQVYGATETGPVSIYLRRGEAMQQVGSAGRAGLHVQVRLVDAHGEDARPGTVGEIWLKAPNLMQAYWRDPANPAFQDGWFHTGDLARQDAHGYYWVVGRSKDMIISGGENIYPAEIENILADCPQIAEVAVVGVPDERWGEVAVAVVVPESVRHPGSTNEPALQESDVLQLLDGQLARFKWPRHVLFRAALPKTALGKVIKAELGQAVRQALGMLRPEPARGKKHY